MDRDILLRSLNYFVNFTRPGSREICDILMEKDIDFFPSPTYGPSWLKVNEITYVGEEMIRKALDSCRS